ncbi:MAG: hypothetical protein ABEK84_07905, partial [Salinibacter sp.]
MLENGRITTARSGAPPEVVQNGWLFDYTQTRLTDLSLVASVQTSGTNSTLQVESASFALPELNLRAPSLHGRLHKTLSGWSFTNLDLSFDTTRVRGRASITPASNTSPPSFAL